MSDLLVCHNFYNNLSQDYKDQLLTKVNLDHDHNAEPGKISMFVDRIMTNSNPDMLLAIDTATGSIVGWIADFGWTDGSGPIHKTFLRMAYVTKERRKTGVYKKLLNIWKFMRE